MVGVRGWIHGRWRRARGAAQSFGKQAKDVGTAAKRRSSAAWRAVKEWARSNPPSVIALAITLLAVSVLWVEWWLIGGKTILALDAFDSICEPDKKVEAFGKLLPAIGLLAAAPVGVVGVALAIWRTWNQHRDGLTAIRKLEAEACAKAVEQMNHKESFIRIGAILDLTTIGEFNPRMLSKTIDYLCEFIREKRPSISIIDNDSMIKNYQNNFFPRDIEIAIKSVCNLNKISVESEINRSVNLSRIYIMGFSFDNDCMESANFYMSNLEKTEILSSNFRKSNFAEAKLGNSKIIDTDMSETNLFHARLSGATLIRVNLRGAFIDNSFFTDTIFEKTTLPDGRVWTGKGLPPDLASDPAPVTNA